MQAKIPNGYRVAVLLWAIVLLSGCVMTTPVPDDHYYRLPPVAVTDRLPTPLFAGPLLLAPVRSSGILDERSLLYTTEAKPDELQRYYYRHWVDAPARMIHAQFSNWLEQRGVAATLLGNSRQQPAMARLDTTLLQFERLMAKDEIKVRVALKLRLENLTSNSVLLAKTYHAEVVAADASVYQTVVAYSRALGDIYSRWLRDVAGVLQ